MEESALNEGDQPHKQAFTDLPTKFGDRLSRLVADVNQVSWNQVSLSRATCARSLLRKRFKKRLSSPEQIVHYTESIKLCVCTYLSEFNTLDTTHI